MVLNTSLIYNCHSVQKNPTFPGMTLNFSSELRIWGILSCQHLQGAPGFVPFSVLDRGIDIEFVPHHLWASTL